MKQVKCVLLTTGLRADKTWLSSTRLILTSSTIDKKLENYIKLEIELEIYKNLEYELEIDKNLEHFEPNFEFFLSISSSYSSFL